MADVLEDKSAHGINMREKALQLAISEIEAYKSSVLPDKPTDLLIKSAESIARFLSGDKAPA